MPFNKGFFSHKLPRKAPEQQLLLILTGFSNEAGFNSLYHHSAEQNQESYLFKLQLLQGNIKMAFHYV